jgi:transposase
MQEVSTIGLDIAKSVFQVHGVDADGNVVLRRRLSRSKVVAFFAELPPCLVGIEGCPTAHHWPRELEKLGNTIAEDDGNGWNTAAIGGNSSST